MSRAMTAHPILVIGTRRSPLALAQAEEARASLRAALGLAEEGLRLLPMVSTGDRIQDRPLAEAGGKGLFTKELDEALLDGRIAFAVHSAKDLPTLLPEGLAIAGYLPREDPRDVLVAGGAAGLHDLPAGALVGSASLRRQALLLRARPDLRVALLRGSVQTRLDAVASGRVGATLLALAGLRRLGLQGRASAILDPDLMLPAVGQGAIALVTRADDAVARSAAERVACPETGAALAAERAFLAVLDGSCRTPIAGHATLGGAELTFRGLVVRPDGRDAVETRGAGPAADAEALGRAAGLDLRARLPAGWIAG